VRQFVTTAPEKKSLSLGQTRAINRRLKCTESTKLNRAADVHQRTSRAVNKHSTSRECVGWQQWRL